MTMTYYVVQAYNESIVVTDERDSALLGYSFSLYYLGNKKNIVMKQ